MNILTLLRESKQILFICPCCGHVYRLSDATIFTKESPLPSDFDRLEEAERRFARAVQRFEDREDALRQKAIARGQMAAQKQLRCIAKPFADCEIDPQDVKVIFHPVEFVAFRGMSDGDVAKVVLIDRPAESKEHEKLQQSVLQAVESGNYAWKLLRIDSEGRVTEE